MALKILPGRWVETTPNYRQDIFNFNVSRGLQLQLSEGFEINVHYGYSFLVLPTEYTYRR